VPQGDFKRLAHAAGNKSCNPSVYKLFSLSVIWRTKFADLLAIFSADLNDGAPYQWAFPLQAASWKFENRN
jgi:hypothetical protein